MSASKFKIKKTAVAVLLAIGMISGYGVSKAYAYFTDTGGLNNVMPVGSNKTTIQETFNPPSEIAYNTPTAYTKDVSVKNTGTVPCYVRVFMDFSDDSARASSTVSGDGANYYGMADYASHLPSGWTYQSTGDLAGYYYYTGVLKPGESTASLLKSVKTNIQSHNAQHDFDILVKEESVQAQSPDGSSQMSYDAAWKAFLAR